MTDERSSVDGILPDTGSDQEITRSANYAHNAVDNSLVIDLGRDIEVSFLRIGPQPVVKRLSGDDDDERMAVKFRPDNVEVARIRLSPSAGLQLAMSMLQRLKDGDHIHTEALLEAINEMLAESTPTMDSNDA